MEHWEYVTLLHRDILANADAENYPRFINIAIEAEVQRRTSQ